MAETAINETMLNRTTGMKFILCDYTKVGVKHSFISGSIDAINYLVTDINADEDAVQAIEEHKVNVIRLKPLMIVPASDDLNRKFLPMRFNVLE